MSEKIKHMILQSDIYRSGKPFMAKDVSDLLQENGTPMSIEFIKSIIRDMAMDNQVRELPGRNPGEAGEYVSVRGSRELLSKLWRPNSIESLGIGA